MRKGLILLVVLVMALTLAAEEKKYKVAVMEFDDQTKKLSKSMLETAAEYLRGELVASNQFVVISKDRQRMVVKEKKKESWKECYDQSCRIQLGQALSADSILTGTISEFGSSYILTLELIDLAQEATVKGAKSEFDGSENGLKSAIAITVALIGGKKKGSTFQEGKIGEQVEAWEIGQGEETIVKFDSVPTGAVVMVDGKLLCQTTPCSKMLTQGKHEITVQKENYLPKTKVFDIVKGRPPLVAELQPDFGWITIDANWTGIDIVLDGKSIGYTPIATMALNPGPHQVEAKHSCFYQVGEKFVLARGETKNIYLDLQSREAAIKVTAQDKDGNDLVADVLVDDKKVGATPSTFKVSACAEKILVRANAGQYEQKLVLEEKKISTVNAVLKKSAPARLAKDIFSYDAIFKIPIDNRSLAQRDKAIEQLLELLQDFPEGPKKAEVYRRLAELYWEKARGIKAILTTDYYKANGPNASISQLDLKEAWKWNEKVIDICDFIIKKYPNFTGIDEVYFFMASNLMEVGKPLPAVRYGTLVAEKYRNSKYAADAFYETAEYFFSNNNVFKAMPAYKAILDYYPNSIFVGYAILRYAESLYNVGEYEEAKKVANKGKDYWVKKNSDEMVNMADSLIDRIVKDLRGEGK